MANKPTIPPEEWERLKAEAKLDLLNDQRKANGYLTEPTLFVALRPSVTNNRLGETIHVRKPAAYSEDYIKGDVRLYCYCPENRLIDSLKIFVGDLVRCGVGDLDLEMIPSGRSPAWRRATKEEAETGIPIQDLAELRRLNSAVETVEAERSRGTDAIADREDQIAKLKAEISEWRSLLSGSLAEKLKVEKAAREAFVADWSKEKRAAIARLLEARSNHEKAYIESKTPSWEREKATA